MRHALACLVFVMTGSPAEAGEVQQAPFEVVVADLQSQDPGVRVRALRQLDGSGYPEAAEAISALARDPEDGIQTEAIGATLRLLVGVRLAGGDDDFSGALAAFDAGLAPVVAVPPATFGHLAAAMGDRNAGVRRQAAAAFAVLAARRPADVPADAASVAERALVVMLGAPEPAVRITAARVAGRFYGAPLDSDGTLAARALPVTVGDALIALLNQPTEIERLVAMESLGLARDVRAVSALTERHAYHVRNGPRLERAATLDALARIGHPSSLVLFTAALEDGWDAVRQLGYEGLARTTDREGASSTLGARPRDRRVHVALAHAFAYARLQADEGLAEIIEALGPSATRAQARGYLLELGAAVTAPLSAALGHGAADVRSALADVLGLAGTREAIAPLTPFASDRNRTVADAAARAIGRLEAGLSSGTNAPR